jgi:phosphate-selective porin OprO/OprP
MNDFRGPVIAGMMTFALLGISNAQGADTEALEKRIRELEKRLEKMEQLENRLEKLDRAAALPKPAIAAAPPLPEVVKEPAMAATALSPEVIKLTRKVNILERKLEVQDEVTAAALQKLPSFDAGADGFRITSADKRHQLRLGGTLQTDYRNFVGHNAPVWTPASTSAGWYAPAGPDSVFLRQTRIILDGYLFNNIYFKIMPDFAAGSSDILPDAYIDYVYHPAAALLVGKFKPSISLERLQGDADTVFLERGFPSSLAPNRDAGIQFHGAFAKPGYRTEPAAGAIDSKNALTYQIGISDGTGDNGNPNYSGIPINNNTATALADNKEFDGRIFAQPFQHSGYSWLEGIGIGVAGSFSNPNHQAINAQKTLLGQSQFLDYTSLTGQAGTGRTITANGHSHRIYPQAYWYAGQYGLMGEYVLSSQTLAVSGQAANSSYNNISQTNKAAQVQVSYVVTGEDNSFTGVKPMRIFDPLKGTWGALQLAARWSDLIVDKDSFRVLDPTKSASKATAWTLGANWFLNRNALIRFDYEDVSFVGGAGTVTGTGARSVYHVANRPTERVISTRFQISF